jgi:hypothetical protein
VANVVVKGIDQTTGRARPIVSADVAVKTDLSSIVGDKLGVASGIATLDGSSLVVQNPASATAALTANAIVRRGADNSILVNTTPTLPGEATSKSYVDSLAVSPILSVTSVDFKVVATTNLYTVPVGKTCIILDTVIRPTSLTAPVGDAMVGVGIAAGEDDIFASQTLTGMTTLTSRYKFPSNGTSRIGVAGEIIKLGVDVADTGTALVGDVTVLGYLI